MRRYAMFNGEYGFDETTMPQPANVHETYDIEDDEPEGDVICNPRVDYECDGDLLDNFSGWEYDEEAYDIFELKEKLDECKKQFDRLKATVYSLHEENKIPKYHEFIDALVERIDADIYELGIYIGNPMIYSGDIDMKVIVQTLLDTGMLPDMHFLKEELALIQE